LLYGDNRFESGVIVMKVTLKDIADRVNVSISTVSRVLNHVPCSVQEETREKILQVAEELGYKSTKKTEQSSRKFSERKIGCILNNMKDKYHDAYFSEIIYGIERELLDQGLILCFTYDTQDLEQPSVMEELLSIDNLGVICIGPMNSDVLKSLSKKVPYLISAGGYPGLDLDYVTVDFKQAVKTATEYLIDGGHRRIAWIGGDSPASGFPMEQEMRFLGFKAAMEERGVALKPEWIKNGKFDITGGYEAMKAILSQPELPTALVTASDRMAYGAYKAIQEKGLSIPDDMAVVSFDDLEMSQFMNPPLTTVRVYKEDMGRIAVRMLLQKMDGNLPLPMTSLLPTQFMIRESSGRRKGG